MQKLKEKIQNLNLALKFRLLYGIIIFSIITIILAFFVINSKINSKIDTLNNKYLNNYTELFNIILSVEKNVITNHIEIQKKTNLIEIQRINYESSTVINDLISKYEIGITTIDEVILLDEFTTEFNNYQNIISETFTYFKKNQDSVANIILLEKEYSSFEKLQLIFLKQKELYSNNINTSIAQIKSYKVSSVTFAIIFSTIVFMLVIVVIFITFSGYIPYLNSIKKNLNDLTIGIIPEEKLQYQKNEVGELANNVNVISENLQSIEYFINHISTGDYNIDITEFSKNNLIGNSLQKLKFNLSETQKENEKRKLEDERKNWANQGLTKFSEILRSSSENIQNLGDEIIKNIVFYLDAKVGGLFLFVEDTDNYLVLLSAFAFDRKKYYTKRIEIGEGLVGMCALEKSTIYITDIPKDYMEIESGLGDSPPKSILIVPLKTETGILGVIEIASFKTFEDFEIVFAEEVAESIASTISSVKINARTAQLLEESQKQSVELAKREQELTVTMQEMQITQEESKRRAAEMASILNGVDQTLLKIEVSTEGKILNVNQRLLRTLGYIEEEIRSKKLESIFPEENRTKIAEIWKALLDGQSFRETERLKNKEGKDIWLLSQYTPIFGTKGDVIRILYLANDISEQKEIEDKNRKLLDESVNKTTELLVAQKKMAENEIEMNSILTAIDQTLMKAEYSVEGNLLSANRRHIETMGYDFEKTKGQNILTFIQDEEKENFKKLWNEVCNGVLRQITVKRQSKTTGNDIWLLNQYTPVEDATGKILKVLYTAIDITEQKQIEEKNKKLLEETMLNQQLMVKNEIELQSVITAIDQTLMKAEYSVEGSLLSANKRHIETMAYNFEESKGANIMIFIPEDEKEDFKKLWLSVCEGNLHKKTVKRKSKTTGKDLWLLNQYTPVKDKSGLVQKILYTAIDITEQKIIEEKNQIFLEEAINREQELKNTQEDMSKKEIELKSIITAIDQTLMKAEYSVEGNLLSANQRHIDTLGYDYQKTLGENILTFIPEDEKESFKKLWENVAQGNMFQVAVKRKSKTTGKDLWLLNQYTPVKDNNNKVWKILYIAIDITEQKQIEDELLQQEEEMKLNMEELFQKQLELENKIEYLENNEKKITNKYNQSKDFKYNEWLKKFY